jgi:hypothetical protein
MGPEFKSGIKNVNNMNIKSCGKSRITRNITKSEIRKLSNFPLVTVNDIYVVNIALKKMKIITSIAKVRRIFH